MRPSDPPGSTGRTVISTSRLRLREYLRADVDERAAMFADEQTMRYYPRLKSRDETVAWVEWNLESYRHHGPSESWGWRVAGWVAASSE